MYNRLRFYFQVIHQVYNQGPLAQPVEHRTFNPQVPSSSLGRPTIFSDIAQLVEQVAVNHLVAGSSPAVGAIFRSYRLEVRMPPFHGGDRGSIPLRTTRTEAVVH